MPALHQALLQTPATRPLPGMAVDLSTLTIDCATFLTRSRRMDFAIMCFGIGVGLLLYSLLHPSLECDECSHTDSGVTVQQPRRRRSRRSPKSAGADKDPELGDDTASCQHRPSMGMKGGAGRSGRVAVPVTVFVPASQPASHDDSE